MSGLFTIRRAGAHDAPVITAITDAAYSKWIELIGRKPLPMTVDYSVAVRDHRIDLALAEGQTIALIEMIDNGDHLMIENLAVLPTRQGQGVGAFLLEHAQTVAQTLGVSTIRLLTNAKFQSNIEFYHRHGYAIDRTEAFKGGEIVHMKKSIV